MALVAQSKAYCKQLNALAEILAAEIRSNGPIPFDRFMALALYHPDLGYYERASPAPSNLNPNPNLNLPPRDSHSPLITGTPSPTASPSPLITEDSSLITSDSPLITSDPVGLHGDFYTSVTVGPLFGELLAFQFAEWLGEFESAIPHSSLSTQHFQIVESGAHDGRLAADILNWIRDHRPELFNTHGLEYWIIEPSPRRRARQSETLAANGHANRVKWFADWPEIPGGENGGVNGVIFSNELLDSFPIRRFGWDARVRKWFEWGVTLESGRFTRTRLPMPGDFRPPNCRFITEELEAVLPDGYIIEHCPAAGDWWRSAAAALRRGHLLTIDYGLTRDEIIIPERVTGTLRGYRGHHVVDDLLADPGEQDLTAHVNFAVLQAVGEAEGLATDDLVTQSRFLSKIAQRAMQPNAGFGDWTPARVRQFQTLTHPDHLGRPFRVFIQQRGN